MVDQAELFRIADAILAEGKIPSVRSVRAELSKGGSFSDIGPMFSEWSLARGFRPRPTKDDVPHSLQDGLAKVAAQIWAHGRDQGRNSTLNEHDELAGKFDALKLAYVAAMGRVRALEERLGIAEADADGGHDDADECPGRRGRATAFWNRVMQEVADRIGNQQLSPEVAFRLLDAETHREAEEWSKPKAWSAKVLGGKMKGRAREGRYLEALGNDLYRALRAEMALPIDRPDASNSHPEAVAAGRTNAPEPVDQPAVRNTTSESLATDRQGREPNAVEEAPGSDQAKSEAVIQPPLRNLRARPADDTVEEAMDRAKFSIHGRPVAS